MTDRRRGALVLSAGLAILAAIAVCAGLPPLAGSHAAMHTRRAAAARDRLDPEQALARLEQLDASQPDAPEEATQLVHAAMLHHWPDEGQRDAETECRFVDDPLVWLRLRLLDALGGDPSELARRERGDWRSALRLGVGYCSQQSIVLAGALRARGIDARAVGLGGHVVVVARNGDRERVLDPDFGVVLPEGLAAAEHAPEVVRAAYLGAGTDAATAARLSAIYAPAGNGDYPAKLLGRWTGAGAATLLASALVGLVLLLRGARRLTASSTRDAQRRHRESARHHDPA